MERTEGHGEMVSSGNIGEGQMHPFSQEVLERFPELRETLFEGDEELAYLMARNLVNWLARGVIHPLPEDVTRRVLDFYAWCKSQPAGKDASDDIMTIMMVGFVEHLFEHADLLPLLGRLMTRKELGDNRDYWVTWVGKERYEAAMRAVRK
jgi:hypothetical protein